jgi:polar amino acid transport system substrate-binding protein
MKKKYLFMAILIIISTAVIAEAWSWYLDYKEADKSLSAIKKRGVLVVGSEIPYGVMEFFDSNHQPIGVDVDIAKEIASRLGVTLKFENYDWDTLFLKVKTGKVDLAISSMTITSQRQKEMLFSNPYFDGGQVIIVQSGNSSIEGVNDLAGKKIAVQKDSTGYTEAAKYTSSERIYSYPNFDSSSDGTGIIVDLKNGKFDAIIVDYIQALNLIKNDSEMKIVGVPFTKESYGIATEIDHVLLIKKINSILADMEKDGTLQAIKTKWTRY